MPDPAWLEELRRHLARRKLPAAYAARLMDELSDHVTDFMEDQMSTDALESRGLVERLGSPQEIARQAAREFTRHRFSGRHPVLMFAVLPVFVLVAGYVASLFGVMGLGRVMKLVSPAMSSDSFSPVAAGAMRLACMAALLLPAVATAALFAWLAARAGLQRKWPIVTGVIVGVLAGLSQMDIYVSPQSGKSSLSLGLGFGTATAFFQLAKFAVPMMFALWIFARQARQGRGVMAS